MTDILAVDAQLEANYSALAKTYMLPSFDEINNAFEIRNVVRREQAVPDYLLRFVRRRIVYILDSWTNYLHGIVMPGQNSMILFEESNHFTEEEKNAAIALMKRIMRINRLSTILEVDRDEQKDAEFIIEVWDRYNTLHEELTPFLKKSLSVWEKDE